MFVFHGALSCHSCHFSLNKIRLFRVDSFVFVCAGAADKGQSQRQEPAGAQESISNQVSFPTRQEKRQKAEL